jgi:hypothetical protein
VKSFQSNSDIVLFNSATIGCGATHRATEGDKSSLSEACEGQIVEVVPWPRRLASGDQGVKRESSRGPVRCLEGLELW